MKKLPLPQGIRNVFAVLHKEGILEKGLSERLQKMVGFRNIAIHDYQKLSLPILVSVISDGLVDFEVCITAVFKSLQ